MQETPGVRSQRQYSIGVIVIVLGVAVAIGLLLAQLFGQLTGRLPDIQVVVPGQHEFYLAEPGSYTIFHEYRSVVDGTIYATEETGTGMSVTILSAVDSRPAELTKPLATFSYETGRRSGRSVLEFEIDQPGRYILTGTYNSRITGPDLVFAVGQSRMLGSITGIIASLAGGLVIGGTMLARAYLTGRKPRASIPTPGAVTHARD